MTKAEAIALLGSKSLDMSCIAVLEQTRQKDWYTGAAMAFDHAVRIIKEIDTL